MTLYDPDWFRRVGRVEYLGPSRVDGHAPGGQVNGSRGTLAGRAKLGKSFLVLDWLLAVSATGLAMESVTVEIGDCLYSALEDGPRRLRSRIRQLLPDERDRKNLDLLTVWMSAPRLDQGLIDQLDAWASSVPEPRLIAIDVFAKITPAGRKGENAYDADYRALSPLQEWATRRNIAVVLLHHTRKTAAEDPLEMLSGSNGVPGAADTVLVLNKDANGTTLYVRGRDIEEKQMALRFDEGWWTVIGAADDVRRSKERAKIIAVINEASEPVGPSEIAKAAGMKDANVRFLLGKLTKEGVIEKAERGRYRRPASTAHIAHNAHIRDEDA